MSATVKPAGNGPPADAGATVVAGDDVVGAATVVAVVDGVLVDVVDVAVLWDDEHPATTTTRARGRIRSSFVVTSNRTPHGSPMFHDLPE